MAKAKEKVKPTLVTFLIDRSGSMESIRGSTIEGFNEYLKGLQAGGDAIKFTRLQFDQNNRNCDIQKDCVAEPVKSVKPLDMGSYRPRGMTPLIEAAHKTINAVEASLSKFDKKHQVIVCIQTDGHENASSPEYNWAKLKELVEEKTKAGWVFNFLGTGIDAYGQAAAMGVSTANTMSTGKSDAHVRASMRSMSASNMRYAATGDVALASFTAGERHDSGEHTIHQGQIPGTVWSPGQPSQFSLDPGVVGSTSEAPPDSSLDLTP